MWYLRVVGAVWEQELPGSHTCCPGPQLDRKRGGPGWPGSGRDATLPGSAICPVVLAIANKPWRIALHRRPHHALMA